MSDQEELFYVAVDPTGAYHQAYKGGWNTERQAYVDEEGYYDSPSEGRLITRTSLRLFANPKNWLQQQRRPSEGGVTGGRMFELSWDGQTLRVGREIEGRTNEKPRSAK